MKKLLFIGIAGHAMRGLALAAQKLGNEVIGLDEGAVSPGSDWLDEHGLDWTTTPDLSLLDGVDAVIISGGTPADYPLLIEAQRQGIKIESFAEYLGRVTEGKHVISVGGTHGKTTTTSLVTWLLEAAGRKPDFLIGIQPFNFPASARLTGSDVVVIEGDEYRSSHLEDTSKLEYYHPNTLVLTSVEHDHPDVFPDLASVVSRFSSIVGKVPQDGLLIAWNGSETVMSIAKSAKCPVLTYGLEVGDYVARDIAYLPTGIEFDVETPEGILGRLAVPLFGRHNVLNALAAIAVCLAEGLSFDQILEGATTFKGAYRRFNVITQPDDKITIIDDYAHHPTEVATTIEAAKLHFRHHRIVVIFRPHTFSRTEALLKEYQASFGDADVVYLTDIEGARENGHTHTVTSDDIAKALKGEVHYVPDRQDLADMVIANTLPGDVILSMTVSGYDKLTGELLTKLT